MYKIAKLVPKVRKINKLAIFVYLETEKAVSLQPLSTLSASSLQLLHERTMINTDLDLDFLDESASSNPFQPHLESASVTSSQMGLLLHPLAERK